jgi:hypothetical protein
VRSLTRAVAVGGVVAALVASMSTADAHKHHSKPPTLAKAYSVAVPDPGGAYTEPELINNAGTVIMSNGGGIYKHKLTYPQGDKPDTSGLPSADWYDINDKGLAVGALYADPTTPQAILWTVGKPSSARTPDLSSLGGTASALYVIDDKGEIAGEVFTDSTSTGFYMKSATAKPQLVTVPGTKTPAFIIAMNPAWEVLQVEPGTGPVYYRVNRKTGKVDNLTKEAGTSSYFSIGSHGLSANGSVLLRIQNVNRPAARAATSFVITTKDKKIHMPYAVTLADSGAASGVIYGRKSDQAVLYSASGKATLLNKKISIYDAYLSHNGTFAGFYQGNRDSAGTSTLTAYTLKKAGK